MIRFIYNTVLFLLLLVAVGLSSIMLASFIVEHRNFTNSNTESNTLVFAQDEDYDIMFSGISHARNFSKYNNHQKVERILNKTMINVGQGSALCGMNEQYFYLKYFYSNGNTIAKLIYVLSPPLMYSDQLPIVSTTFKWEVFDFSFLYQYIRFDTENKWQRIWDYLRSKLHPSWIFLKPNFQKDKLNFLTEIDSLKYNEGFKAAYSKNVNPKRFEKSCALLEKQINFAQNHDIEFIILVPPAVFGKWPGHEGVVNFAQKMKEKYQIDYYDFSESVLDPKFYYDHHHLNTKGVIYFTETFLKGIVDR